MRSSEGHGPVVESTEISRQLAAFQKDRWSSLLKSLLTRSASQSILLAGPRGAGATSVVRVLYQRLHCHKGTADPTDWEPCDHCSACEGFSSRRWVDLVEISPNDGVLGVDVIRDLRAKAGFGPTTSGTHKWVVLYEAELLTPQASNALLKILEEPPHGWTFVLSCQDESLVLPTVLSRCLRVRLAPLSPHQVAELLRTAQVAPDRIPVAARLSEGSFDRAVALADDELWARRDLILKFLVAPEAHYTALVDWASESDLTLEILVDQLESSVRDLLEWSVSGELPDSDAKSALLGLCRFAQKNHSAEKLRDRFFSIADRLARARHDLGSPVNRKLAAQSLLTPWLF